MKKNTEKGSVLLLVIAIILFVSLIALSFSKLVDQPGKHQAGEVAINRVIHLAQSGVNWAAAVLQTIPKADRTVENFIKKLEQNPYIKGAKEQGEVALTGFGQANSAYKEIWVTAVAKLNDNTYTLRKQLWIEPINMGKFIISTPSHVTINAANDFEGSIAANSITVAMALDTAGVKGTTITGNLIGKEDVDVSGKVELKGYICVEKDAIVRNGATVTGNVYAGRNFNLGTNSVVGKNVYAGGYIYNGGYLSESDPATAGEVHGGTISGNTYSGGQTWVYHGIIGQSAYARGKITAYTRGIIQKAYSVSEKPGKTHGEFLLPDEVRKITEEEFNAAIEHNFIKNNDLTRPACTGKTCTPQLLDLKKHRIKIDSGESVKFIVDQSKKLEHDFYPGYYNYIYSARTVGLYKKRPFKLYFNRQGHYFFKSIQGSSEKGRLVYPYFYFDLRGYKDNNFEGICIFIDKNLFIYRSKIYLKYDNTGYKSLEELLKTDEGTELAKELAKYVYIEVGGKFTCAGEGASLFGSILTNELDIKQGLHKKGVGSIHVRKDTGEYIENLNLIFSQAQYTEKHPEQWRCP